tara:strand:- start:376 stop:2568 length:2193 start_codon:yes stop_codon:yes gene_type:complete
MKTLLKIFLIFTIAHSDYIRLWIDEVQYIAPSPSDTEDEVYLKIRYDIVQSSSGVDLQNEDGEDINNIKSFRFSLGTFNDPLGLESDLGNIFSLVDILTASSQTAFEAFNPSENNINGFGDFYFAGNDTDGQGLPNQLGGVFLYLHLRYNSSQMDGQYLNIKDITNSLGAQTQFLIDQDGFDVEVDYQWVETTWLLGSDGLGLPMNVEADSNGLWYWYGQDCVGDASGLAMQDDCGVCSGGNSNHEANSDIDCNGNCFGGVLIDDCGVCGGAGIPEGDCDCLGNFLGCDGECSSATEDMCGTCDADSLNDCLQDCDGIWGGGSINQIWYQDCDIDGLADNNIPLTICGNPTSDDITAICGFVPDCSNEFMDGEVLCGLTSNDETFDANPGCLSNSVDLCGECDGFNQHMDCNGLCWEQTPICNDLTYSGYDGDNLSICDSNNYVGLDSNTIFEYNDGYDDCGICGGDNSGCTGCTNPNASNYNVGCVDENENPISCLFYDGSCSFELYPGDANRDGVVNEADIDGLAIFWNEIGGPRDHVSIDWYRQYGNDNWQDVCAGYADANGDGVVNHLDLSAILQNWGNVVSYDLSEPSLCYDVSDIASYRDNFEEILFLLQDQNIEDPIVRDMIEYLSSLLDTDFYPQDFRLYQNYPNPFNPITTIEFDLSVSAKAEITIYNVNGKLVHQYDFGYLSPGLYDYSLDASRLTSGVYIYSINTSSGYSAQKQMILIK